MPVYSDYLDDDRNDPPPPNVPPAQDGGGAPAPAAGGPAVPPPVVNTGGGGGGGGLVRPQFGGVNIPGAPQFKYDPFVAPDRQALLSDPGYLSRLDTGVHALDASAAAKGSLRTGGHGMALEQYGQNLGSQEYGAAFNRGLQQYDRGYQGAKDAFAPQFARWQMQADANKQAGLLGYQTDLNSFLQQSAPYHESIPWELFAGGGAGDAPPDRARYQSAPSTGYGSDPMDDPRRRVDPYGY